MSSGTFLEKINTLKIRKRKKVIFLAIKIFVDQGHSNKVNAGAEGFGMAEQDITYNVGAYLADLLSSDPRFEVRTSRTYPEEEIGFNASSSLIERVRMANNWPADYFVSIHANANVNPAINGTEVYVYESGTEAYYLAEDVLNAIVQTVGTKNNLVRINPSPVSYTHLDVYKRQGNTCSIVF